MRARFLVFNALNANNKRLATSTLSLASRHHVFHAESSGTATDVGALAMALPRRHDSSRLLLLGGFRGARRLIRGDGSLHVTFG